MNHFEFIRSITHFGRKRKRKRYTVTQSVVVMTFLWDI